MSSPTPVFDEVPPRSNPLDDLRRLLQPFDALDLCVTAAALELIPENAERTLRIQALAHVAATLPYREGLPRISASRLRAIVKGPELGALAHGEDPFPNSFVEEVTYYGGSYAVLPGAMSGATFTFQHLCRAIFQEDGVPSYVAAEINRIIVGSLRLSNTMATRAGLRRGTDPASTASDAIVVPESGRLAALKAAATFSRQEMEVFFGEGEMGNRPWSRLTGTPGLVKVDQFTFEDSQLLLNPIRQFGNTFVISCPEALLAAVNHHIIAIAVERGAANSLVQTYTDAIASSVTKFMSYMDIYAVPVHIPGSPIQGSRELLFRCDFDKAIYTLLIADQLTNFQPELASGGDEDTEDLDSKIASRIRQAEEFLYSKPGLNNLLCLFVHAGVGRSVMLGLGDFTNAAVFQPFPAHELETFTYLNGGNSLALWRFAREGSRLRDRGVMVKSWSPLDEFGLYRGRKSSFYLTDKEAPNVLTITSDFSGALRREVLNARDWHAVQHYERDAVIEVTTLHGKKEIPIYIPSSIATDRVAVFVENLPFPLWILGPEEAGDLRKLYAEIASALAYWIWQCSNWLRSNIVPPCARPIIIKLSLSDGGEWQEASADANDSQLAEMIGVSHEITRGEVRLTFQSGSSALFKRADNYGERELLRMAVRGLCNLLNLSSRVPESRISELLDEVAPLGMKKMLLLLNINHLPQLDPRDVPHYRAVQEGDVDDVLGQLGQYLRNSRSLALGPIPVDRRNEIVKDAVSFCFSRLQDLIASHRYAGLLEFLVAQNEAVAREDALRRLTIPTRIACFSSVSDIVRELQEELPEIARTALASRF